jgi:hypothetical protein
MAGFASIVEYFIAKLSSNQTMHNMSLIYCAQYMDLFSSVINRAHRMQDLGVWRPFLVESIDSANGLPMLVQQPKPLEDDDMVRGDQI